ncbi:unnamed protein product [marine sediment metagenome]|uniref:Uncharacterized protein n=1 Tax=marine sediment metagenome TaxID=412755 RepID=X0UL69_9ZZZZ
MISEKVLKIVLEESETMIVEWADTRDGYGVEVIDNKLKAFFKAEEIPENMALVITGNVRSFILMDMAIMIW